MGTCTKCGRKMTDDDLIYWKCTQCGKVFNASFGKMKNLWKQKQAHPGQTLLKCPGCSYGIDDGKERMLYKCMGCGSTMGGNLNSFVSDNDNNLNEYNNPQNNQILSLKCPNCGNSISGQTNFCPECGYQIKDQVVNRQSGLIKYEEEIEYKKKRLSKKHIVIAAIIAGILCVSGITYNFIVVRPRNTYEKALELTNKGEYNDANKLFKSIKTYKDVSEILEQLKYESYAYACINKLKEYLKNPDSYIPYDIEFYSFLDSDSWDKMNVKNISEDVINDNGKFPICIMRYGAQNGFGGNTISYAFFHYSDTDNVYEIIGTCNSLDEDEYDAIDDFSDLLTCAAINMYKGSNNKIGSVDMKRIKTVLKNDAYSTISIIE